MIPTILSVVWALVGFSFIFDGRGFADIAACIILSVMYEILHEVRGDK